MEWSGILPRDDDLGAVIEHAASLRRRGQIDDAIELLLDARSQYPDAAEIDRRLIGLLKMAGRQEQWLDSAYRLLAQEDLPPRPTLDGFVRLAGRHGRWREIADLVGRHGAAALDNPGRLRALVACCREGRAPPADLPDPTPELVAELGRLLVSLLREGHDAAAEAVCEALTASAGAEARVRVQGALVETLIDWGAEAELSGAAELAQRRRERALAIAPTADHRARALVPVVRKRFRAGDVACASRMLGEIDESALSADTQKLLRPLHALRDRLSGAGGTTAAERYLDGFVQHDRAGETACMIWFLNGRVEQDAALMGVVRGILARRDISLMTVVDARRFSSIDGFGPHAGDFPAAAAALKGLVDELGYRSALCMGSSLAASSAIRYGAAIGASGALCFSGFYRLPRPEDLPNPGSRRRAQRLAGALKRPLPTIGEVVAERPDLVIHYHYCEDAPLDRMEMPHFLRLPGLRAFAHEGSSHNVITPIHQGARPAGIYLRFLRDCGLIGNGGD